MKISERRAWLAKVRGVRERLPHATVVRSAIGSAGIDFGLRRTKYRNRATVVDGFRFDSRLEADRYCELKLLRASGEVKYFLRQVPFVLAPGATYRCDFLVVWDTPARWNDLGVTAEETKGFLTEASRVKLAMVEQLYGVRVRILKRADVARFS